MENLALTYSVDKKTLTITIDLTRELGPSSSGKTTLVASTGPAVKVESPDGVELRLGLNLYKKK